MNKNQLLKSLRLHSFSKEIIGAFKKVKRENFLPKDLKRYAYEDNALPLEKGATISQPYTIAFMLSLLELKKDQNILEIGSGSGYVLALISQIIKKGKIYGIEIIKSLAESSKKVLSKNKKIKILNKDGLYGLPKYALYDRILISAAAQEIPEHLYSQLKEDAIIVTPVKNSIFQIKKHKNEITVKEFPGFIFVPLVNNETKSIP